VTALPPAGWYPDPEAGGSRWRWWDGAQWAPPGYGYVYTAFDPTAHAHALAMRAESTRKMSQWLRWLMVTNSLGVLGFAVLTASVGGFWFGDSTGGAIAMGVFSVVFGFGSWAFTGVLIAWLYTLGKYADLQPWPTIRSRTLGAFSILIPIVQLWWPYEVIRDSFPRESPPVLALRWWLSYLLAPICVSIPVFFAAVLLPTSATIVVLIIAAGVLTIPVVLGWRLIADVEAMQRAHLPAA
jgi:hypothetical protein